MRLSGKLHLDKLTVICHRNAPVIEKIAVHDLEERAVIEQIPDMLLQLLGILK